MTDAPPPARKFESLGKRSGTILGRYELVRRIGTGGMAEVYEAVHRGLKKTVAVKVLLPETAGNPELRARFLREGEAASRIQHPHVVDVTDVGEEHGVPYLVMEYLEGETLSQLLAESPENRLSLSRTLDILLPVAAALEEAHRQGVVHRDLKPENVFISRAPNGKAVPKILDFGVSKLTTAGVPSHTAVSAVLGTPHYMSPEQARGEREIDGRADQYSFALMVFECVTGALPFRSDNVVALIHEVAAGVGTPPTALLATVPPELDIVLLKALGARPEQRYESVADLAQKLLDFASPRGRDAYRALREREPRNALPSLPPPASEITGTFGPASTTPTSGANQVTTLPPPAEAPRHPTPTIAARPSGKALAPTPHAGVETGPAPDARLLAVSAVVLLLGGGIGAWLWLGQGSAGESSTTTTGAPPSAGSATPPVHETPSVVPPPTPPPPVVPGTTEVEPALETVHVAVVTVPATAEILLDGQPVGTGELDRTVPIDGETHALTVRAAGFIERTIEFSDTPPPMRVTLDAVPRSGTGHRPPPTGGTDVRRPPPPDEDIRSTR
jgi:serine/threonine-protein kinase